jgi:hypothetical protein
VKRATAKEKGLSPSLLSFRKHGHHITDNHALCFACSEQISTFVVAKHHFARGVIHNLNITESVYQHECDSVCHAEGLALEGDFHSFVVVSDYSKGGVVGVVKFGSHSMFPFFWSGCSLFLCVFIIAHFWLFVKGFLKNFLIFFLLYHTKARFELLGLNEKESFRSL